MKLLVAAFIAFLLPLDSFAQEAPVLDGRLKKIRDTKSIAIAHRTDAAPFSFEDNKKQVTGYSVDLCRRVVGAIERQLGLSELKIKWVPVTVQNRFDAVAKGQADMECGSSTVTLSRMKTVDFSSFIFVDGTGLLVKATQAAASLGDFSGKKIGVIGGTSNERALNDALKRRVVNATVLPLKSSDEGLAQVESGEIDAFASDRVLLMALAGKSKDSKATRVTRRRTFVRALCDCTTAWRLANALGGQHGAGADLPQRRYRRNLRPLVWRAGSARSIDRSDVPVRSVAGVAVGPVDSLAVKCAR